jgi:hypothetical protein
MNTEERIYVEQLEKAFEMACNLLFDSTGECPYNFTEDAESICNCNNCDDVEEANYFVECWKEYFMSKCKREVLK